MKEMYYLSLTLSEISFVSIPEALRAILIAKLVVRTVRNNRVIF